jgi:hypothetical protein
MGERRDDVGYVEQSGWISELHASLRVDNRPRPPLVWTCPVCAGDAQADEIREEVIVGVEAVTHMPPIDVVCHCGHVHDDHDGCGYGAQVAVPTAMLDHAEE